MGRLYLLAIVASGCLRASDGPSSSDDTAAPTPELFQFHLVVHVFGGNGVVISASNGQTSEHVFAEYKYASSAAMPANGLLPLTVNGLPIAINTLACAGPNLVYEHVILSSVMAIDDTAVSGTIAYDCTYVDGSTQTVPASTGVFIDQGGTPL